MSDRSESKLPKILRIGVIQGGKIIEERLLKRRETVVVGSNPRSTLVVSGAGVPASFVLFELRSGAYHLRFTDQMEGKLSTGEGPQTDFQSLVAQGFAKRHDAAYILPLTDASRGKVSLGETTLLFQFVAPPPEKAKTKNKKKKKEK